MQLHRTGQSLQQQCSSSARQQSATGLICCSLDVLENKGSKDGAVLTLPLTKLDVLAVLGLELLTGNSDLTAVAVVENSRSVDGACNKAVATGGLPSLVLSFGSLHQVVTYENFAVFAVCDFDLGGVVQQIYSVPPADVRYAEKLNIAIRSQRKTYVQSVKLFSTKLSLQTVS